MLPSRQKRPTKSVWSTYTVKRQTWVWRSSPNLMAASRAVELLQEEQYLAMECGCALFAALCKENLIYIQPMNQFTLNLLNLNPKKLFCLDLRLGRPLALSVGQLQDEQVYRPWIPSVLEVWGSGLDLPWRKRIKRHVLPRCHHPTSAWSSQAVAWRSSKRRDRRLRAGLGFDGRGWITSKSPGIPAAVELDELKELYKKNNNKKLWNMTKHNRVATRHIDSSCGHTTCTCFSKSNTQWLSPVTTNTQQGYTNIRWHTHTNHCSI